MVAIAAGHKLGGNLGCKQPYTKGQQHHGGEEYDLLVTNGRATAALTRLSFVDAMSQNISGAIALLDEAIMQGREMSQFVVAMS